MHCEIDGEPLSLVSLFTLQTHVSDRGYAVWKVGDDGAETVHTSDILDVVIYSHWADDVVFTLLPIDYR